MSHSFNRSLENVSRKTSRLFTRELRSSPVSDYFNSNGGHQMVAPDVWCFYLITNFITSSPLTYFKSSCFKHKTVIYIINCQHDSISIIRFWVKKELTWSGWYQVVFFLFFLSKVLKSRSAAAVGGHCTLCWQATNEITQSFACFKFVCEYLQCLLRLKTPPTTKFALRLVSAKKADSPSWQ